MAEVAAAVLSVEVVYSPAPRQTHVYPLRLPAGSRVVDALRASGLREAFPTLDLDGLALSAWGRRARPDQLLREHDRIELCRGLLVDPKVARRERFARQGTRGTGLFARRRPGGKAGY